MSIPNELTPRRWNLIKALGNYALSNPDQPYAAPPDLIDSYPGSTDDLRKDVSNLYQTRKGWMKRKKMTGQSGFLYKLSGEGLEVFNNLENITQSKQQYRGRIPGAKDKKPRHNRTVTPAPVAMNISETADKLADVTSSLIQENHEYRRLMTDVYMLISQRLGLDKTEGEQHNGNSD